MSSPCRNLGIPDPSHWFGAPKCPGTKHVSFQDGSAESQFKPGQIPPQLTMAAAEAGS